MKRNSLVVLLWDTVFSLIFFDYPRNALLGKNRAIDGNITNKTATINKMMINGGVCPMTSK